VEFAGVAHDLFRQDYRKQDRAIGRYGAGFLPPADDSAFPTDFPAENLKVSTRIIDAGFFILSKYSSGVSRFIGGFGGVNLMRGIDWGLILWYLSGNSPFSQRRR